MKIRKNTIFGGITVIVVVLVGIYFGLGYYIFNELTNITSECGVHWMADKINNTPTEFVKQFRIVDEPENVPDLWMPAYDDVSFQSREDDVTIAGWYIPVVEASDQVIILAHGHNGCKRDSTVLLPASMLHRGGFNVLMIDLRNHGASEVVTGRMTAGVTEYNDVLGAFDYLQTQGFSTNNIGVMGLSNGAATSAIAFGQDPNIPALWLDSPFADIRDVLDSQISDAGLPASILRPAAIQVARLSGVDLVAFTPETSIQNHNERPIVVTHGEADAFVLFESGEAVFNNAGSNATFIPVPDSEHVEAVYIDDAYEDTLVAFFTENLGN